MRPEQGLFQGFHKRFVDEPKISTANSEIFSMLKARFADAERLISFVIAGGGPELRP
jgi:hypothetical protein